MEGNIKTGIIILNYIKWEETVRCTESILNTCGIPVIIYIIDNGSPNNSYNKLETEYKDISNIRLIHNKNNVGYAAGNNIGIVEAIKDNIEYIVVANSDVIFEKEAVEKMVSFMERNKSCGIVGPNLKDLNGEYNKAARINERKMKEIFFSNFKFNIFGTRTKVLKNYHYLNIPFEETHQVEMVSGACYCIKTAFLKEYGLLDENTFLYFEEPILSFKLKKAGFEAFHLGEASVIHAHGRSTATVPAFSYIQFCCSYIYYAKSYLKKKNMQIMPMYLLFTLKYFYKVLISDNYRRNINVYFYETFIRLKDPQGKKSTNLQGNNVISRSNGSI